MALSDFVNGYTSVPFYSQYSLSSHSVGVPQKMLCCTKSYIESTKKIFHIKVGLPTKITWSQKICFGNKLCDTKKRDSCWLDMFSVGHKRNTCWQKKVHVVSKYMFYRLEKFCVARKILWSRKKIKIDVYKCY